MESKFIPTLQAGNGYTYLKLKGVLDEDNLLANLLSQIQGRLLLIDMAEIERINSCGVRDWVNWLNQIQALGVAVILLRCSPVVVSQANMVANFAADAFIHSFYAPYVHPDTGDEQSVLLFTEDIRQNQPIRAPKIYSDNGEELEFDEFEESYFAFINDPRIMTYQIPSDIQAVIQYFLPEAATRQPVVSSPIQESASPVQQANAYNPSNPVQNVQGYGAGNYGNAQGYGASPYASPQPQNPPRPGGIPGNRSVAAVPPVQPAASPRIVPSAAPQNPMNGYGSQAGYGQQQGGYQAPHQSIPPRSPYPQPQSQRASESALMPQPAQPFRHEQPPLPSDNSIANTQPQQTAARPSMVAPATPVQAPGAYNPPQQPSAAAMPPARMGQPQPAAPGNDKPIPSVVRNMPIRQDAPAPAPGVSVSNGHQRNSIEALHQPTIALQNSPKKLLLLKNQRLILAICVALIVIIVIAIVLILIFKSKS